MQLDQGFHFPKQYYPAALKIIFFNLRCFQISLYFKSLLKMKGKISYKFKLRKFNSHFFKSLEIPVSIFGRQSW